VSKLLALVVDNLRIEPPASYDPGNVDAAAVLSKSKYAASEEGIDDATARRALYWIRQTRPAMCKAIRNWFEAHDMLVEDEKCAKH
jgi:hypothetical protein